MEFYMQKLQKPILLIQCCESCHKHPSNTHSEALYYKYFKLIQKQLERKEQKIRFIKKKQFRQGAFQITLNNLLIYSKLNHKDQETIKIKPQELTMILDILISKSDQKLYKLKIKLKTMFIEQPSKENLRNTILGNIIQNQIPQKRNNMDLFSFFKSKLNGKKFTLKLLDDCIEELIGIKKKYQISKCRTERKVNIKDKINKFSKRRKDCNKYRTIGLDELNQDCKIENILSQKNMMDSKMSKISKEEKGVSFKNSKFEMELKSSRRGPYIQKRLTEQGNANTSRFKDVVVEVGTKNSKYTYLSQQMDQKPKLQNQTDMINLITSKNAMYMGHKNPQLQKLIAQNEIILEELSDEENKIPIQMEKNKAVQQLMKKEGLVLNVPLKIIANVGSKRDRKKRKYSFELNKDMESIQNELKSQFGQSFRQNTQQNEVKTQQSSLKSSQSISCNQKSVKIKQASEKSLSLQSFDLMSKSKSKVNSERFISVREIYSTNKITDQFEEIKNQVPSDELKILTSEFYSQIQDQIFSKTYDIQKKEQQQNNQQYELTVLDDSLNKLPSKNVASLQISQQNYEQLLKLINKTNQKQNLSQILKLQKIFGFEFSQIFQIVDYKMVSIESYLYMKTVRDVENGLYTLDSEIQLNSYFIPIKIYDKFLSSTINLSISLSLVKKFRQKLAEMCTDMIFVRKKNQFDWIAIIYIGFLVANFWEKKYYKNNDSQFMINLLKISQFELQQERNSNLEEWMKIIAGCPIIKVSIIDLRKIKHILVKQNFGKKISQTNKILCSKKLTKFEESYQEIVGEVQEFKINQINFLESSIQVKVYDQLSIKLQILSYQQFAIRFSQIYFCFCDQSQNITQLISNPATDPDQQWKIIMQVSNEELNKSKLFFQFAEIGLQASKSQNQTKISLKKINKKLRHGKLKVLFEEIGEINRKGSFFFELDLQVGFYICKVIGQLQESLLNSLRILAKGQIQIIHEQNTSETDAKFIIEKLYRK